MQSTQRRKYPACTISHYNNSFAMPFVVASDDAFPLHNNLMKPYPLSNLSSEQRVFNYRLSHARRVVENVFGIFAKRF